MHFLSNIPTIWFWLLPGIVLGGQSYAIVSLWLRQRDKKYARVPVWDWAKLQELLRCYQRGADIGQGLALMTATEREAVAKLAAASGAGYGLVKTDEYQSLFSSPPWVDARKYAEDRAEIERVKHIAEQAYAVTVGLIPDSGISASKVGGAAMVSGLPSDADPMDFIKKK